MKITQSIPRISFFFFSLFVLFSFATEERWERKSGACAKCEPILPRDIHAQRLAAANSKCYPFCSMVGSPKIGKSESTSTVLPSRTGREKKDPITVVPPTQKG